MKYYLGPWVWKTDPSPSWSVPDGVVGSIDLATISQQAQPEDPTLRGVGFFTTPDDVTLSDDYTLIATGDLRTLETTSSMQDAFEDRFHYRPTGATLNDLLADCLTNGSDPTGETACKPLVPTSNNELEIHLGGHSKIWSEKFVWGEHPHTTKLQLLIQEDFRKLYMETLTGQLPTGTDVKVLDMLCEKYGVGKKNYKVFVPDDLKASVGPLLPHETTITESWNANDSTSLTADLTWTEFAGTAWGITSNQARAAGSNLNQEARADSDLSSDDHYAQATLITFTYAGNALQVGVLCRKDETTTRTYYGFVATRSATPSNEHILTRLSSGTNTNIGTAADDVAASPIALKVQADGSTIKGFIGGVEKVSVTDTNITGNVRCGIVYTSNNAGNVGVLDDWEAADLEAAAAIVIGYKLLLGVGL